MPCNCFLQTMPGFIRLLTARDIPAGGINNIVSTHFSMQPEEVCLSFQPNMIVLIQGFLQLFADYLSQYTGQAAALVLAGDYYYMHAWDYQTHYADTRQNAENIAKAVTIEYGEALGPVIVKTEDAVRKNSFFAEGQKSITTGDANGTTPTQ